MRWTRADYAGSAVDTARRLVGAHLVHETPEGRTVLRITEAEAYGGWYEGRPDDGAHAYRGAPPARRSSSVSRDMPTSI